MAQSRSSESGASHVKAGAGNRLRAYLANHVEVAKDSFARLVAAWLSSLMTWAVIGIALALPCLMYVVLENVRQIGSTWQGLARISVYLHSSVTQRAAAALTSNIRDWETVTESSYVSSEEALVEFQRMSGFGDVLVTLDENPLPGLILVRPASEDITLVSNLVRELDELDESEFVSLDMEWLQRLNSLLSLAQRIVLALTAVLGLGVLLIVGNTIRLSIENRRAEIEVVKLVGGTDSFVRRPFLYTGLWYGLGGGMLAWGLLEICFLWLAGPIGELVSLYDSDYELMGLESEVLGVLLGGASVIGLAGAWLAVNRHLDEIVPE